jgi:hypothetical protein
MKHIIIGAGEVGKNIAQNIKGEFSIYDKGEWEDTRASSLYGGPYYVHICIPYNDSFMEIVNRVKLIFNPKITIIHSTIKEGVISKLEDTDKILYSPVVGRHQDDFSESSRKFTKFFAGKRDKYDEVSDYFDYDTQYWGPNYDELVFAKLMSTAYMYWNLVYEKNLFNECKHKGYDHNKVYKRWNRNYNNGYGIDHPEWKRPIYDHVEDARPGGHCLGSNIFLTENHIINILRQWHERKIPI